MKAEGIPHIWWIHEGDVGKHFLNKDADLRATLGLADLIITPDTRSSQLYQPYTNRAIRVLHDGTPDVRAMLPPREAKGKTRDRVEFLLLGTIEQRKGQTGFSRRASEASRRGLAKISLSHCGATE